MTLTRRTERFGLSMSPQERDGLRLLAEIEGLAEADVLRRLLRMAINDLPSEYRQAISWPAPALPKARSGSHPCP